MSVPSVHTEYKRQSLDWSGWFTCSLVDSFFEAHENCKSLQQRKFRRIWSLDVGRLNIGQVLALHLGCHRSLLPIGRSWLLALLIHLNDVSARVIEGCVPRERE